MYFLLLNQKVLRILLRILLHVAWISLVLWGFHYGPGGIAPLGDLLDPARGLYHNARIAEHDVSGIIAMPELDGLVTVERDERGVPHIFAENDQDIVQVLGYVTAQDRLFQMDFVGRVAAGRLSEIFGSGSIEVDQYLRATGMRWAAKRIVKSHEEEGSFDYQLMQWFSDGVNAYINRLSYAEWPFEFKLFGYAPEEYTPLHMALLMQYFNFDLSFESDEAAYGIARQTIECE